MSKVPIDWCDAVLVLIPKKGDLSRCDNWRGISLLDVVGKVVARVIQERLQKLAEDELPSIWDPHHTTYIGKLERVQELAAKVATRRWTDDGPNLVKQLTWPSLKMRRQYLKLCLCRRILHGGSLIPPSVFTPHPSSTVRHVNSSPIFLPRVRTNYHRGSYFISTIPLWNNVPDEITSLTSHLAFKKHLKLQPFKC